MIVFQIFKKQLILLVLRSHDVSMIQIIFDVSKQVPAQMIQVWAAAMPNMVDKISDMICIMPNTIKGEATKGVDTEFKMISPYLWKNHHEEDNNNFDC